MKTVKSGQASAGNWGTAMSSPSTSQRYIAGIDRVTVSPMAQAASPQAEANYVAAIMDSVNSGRRSQKLLASDFNAWKSAAKTLGASGLARGAQKGQKKVADFFTRWQPIFQQASDAAQQLPKGGMANATARWTASTAILMANKGK